MPRISYQAQSVTPFNQSLFLTYVKEQVALGQLALTDADMALLRILLVDASEGQAWVLTENGVPCGFAVCGFLLSVAAGGRIAVFDFLHVPNGLESPLAWVTLLARIEDDLRTLDIHQMVVDVQTQEHAKKTALIERAFLTLTPVTMKKSLTVDDQQGDLE